MKVIDPVPVELDAGEFLQFPGVRALKGQDVSQLIEKSRQLIEPKAVFELVNVAGVYGHGVHLETGHTLKSMVLADMLEHGQKVAPYVVTIGPRLERQASEEAKGSILRSWMLDKVGDYALEKASAYLKSRVGEALKGGVSVFSPGSGTGKLFGIDQQKVIFQILNPSESIGVSLTPGCMMVPRKSLSGVLAVTGREYIACQYCPRERCDNRRKPFSGEYYPLGCEAKAD